MRSFSSKGIFHLEGKDMAVTTDTSSDVQSVWLLAQREEETENRRLDDQ